jgi:ABC-2 type transport system ATP-binding protein
MIQVTGITKAFGKHTVLDGVDLEVRAGEIVALLGPNGAGKTTLVNILTTLVLPDSGAASVAGFDVVAEADQVRRRISLTGQSAAVDGLLTGEENLRMMSRLSGLSPADARARTAELLERLDLTDAARKLVSTYSGGMRRRLDLALSLVVAKPVVFLDEPTTGLDTRSRRELWDAIRALAAEGAAVLLTTQYLEEADQLSDRVALLDGGRIVAVGTADELKARVGEQLSLPTPSLDDVFLALTTSTRQLVSKEH